MLPEWCQMIDEEAAERVKRHLESIEGVLGVEMYPVLKIVTIIPRRAESEDILWDKVIAAELEIMDALRDEGIDLPADFNVHSKDISPLEMLEHYTSDTPNASNEA